MITHVQGDLLLSDERVIAHGCNCVGLMGAGIAAAIRKNYPFAFRAYEFACADKGGFVLGTAQCVLDTDADRFIYNLGTQKAPGRIPDDWENGINGYWGISLAFANMAEHAATMGFHRIGIPRIGAGIGGLDWSHVEWLIENTLAHAGHSDLNIVVYTL